MGALCVNDNDARLCRVGSVGNRRACRAEKGLTGIVPCAREATLGTSRSAHANACQEKILCGRAQCELSDLQESPASEIDLTRI